jgi:hypothetical protein
MILGDISDREYLSRRAIGGTMPRLTKDDKRNLNGAIDVFLLAYVVWKERPSDKLDCNLFS